VLVVEIVGPHVEDLDGLWQRQVGVLEKGSASD
jgi:hypothetical protein